MVERVLSDEHLEKIRNFMDRNDIPALNTSKPEEFDKFTKLISIVEDVEDLKKPQEEALAAELQIA